MFVESSPDFKIVISELVYGLARGLLEVPDDLLQLLRGRGTPGGQCFKTFCVVIVVLKQ